MIHEQQLAAIRRPVPLTSSSGQHIAAAAAAAAAAEHAVASPAAEHLACRSLPEDTFTLRSVHLLTFGRSLPSFFYRSATAAGADFFIVRRRPSLACRCDVSDGVTNESTRSCGALFTSARVYVESASEQGLASHSTHNRSLRRPSTRRQSIALILTNSQRPRENNTRQRKTHRIRTARKSSLEVAPATLARTSRRTPTKVIMRFKLCMLCARLM